MKNKIRDRITAISGEVISMRRWIHQNAEISFKEYKTSAYIEERLKSFGGGLIINRPTPTSVVAVLKTNKPGPVIAIRADIDALPMKEINDLEFKALDENAMHSCGHDGHAAILLGCAKLFLEMKDDLSGELRFVFQHAEEVPPGGGCELIAAGVMNGVDEVFGMHLVSVLQTGQFGVKPGVLTSATDGFTIIVKGKGGHSSMPYDCIDPVIVGAEIISSLQTIISRRIKASEPAIVSVCNVEAGSAYNIIPHTMKLCGSIRTYTNETRELIKSAIKQISEGIAAAHGATIGFDYLYGYDSVYNDEELTQAAVQVIEENFGKEAVQYIEAIPAGDDFSAYHKDCPGFFIEIGAGNIKKGITSPHHNPNYLLDEDALALGIEFIMKLIIKRMGI